MRCEGEGDTCGVGVVRAIGSTLGVWDFSIKMSNLLLQVVHGQLKSDALKGNEQKTASGTKGKTNHPHLFLGLLNIGLVRLPFGTTLDSNC